MKTITVREAAVALNLTKRAVMYRLENGKLKGTRIKNTFGMEEWRIYPTKEIIEGLDRAAAANPTAPQATVYAEELLDVDDVEFEEPFPTPPQDAGNWKEQERERLKLLAEEVVRPLVEKMDAQTKLLVRKELEIEDLRIRLLPDLEKKAEEERKAAELKHMEVTALQKQLEGLNQKVLEQTKKEEEQNKRLQHNLAEISKLKTATKEAESAKQKAAELEAMVPSLQQELEKQNQERAALEEELRKLQEEKKAQAALVQQAVASKKSWWGWFTGQS